MCSKAWRGRKFAIDSKDGLPVGEVRTVLRQEDPLKEEHWTSFVTVAMNSVYDGKSVYILEQSVTGKKFGSA